MAIVPLVIRRVAIDERLVARAYACRACRVFREANVEGRYIYLRANGIPTRVVEESYSYECLSCGAVSSGARPKDAAPIPFMRRNGHKVALGILGGLIATFALVVVVRMWSLNRELNGPRDRVTEPVVKVTVAVPGPRGDAEP